MKIDLNIEPYVPLREDIKNEEKHIIRRVLITYGINSRRKDSTADFTDLIHELYERKKKSKKNNVNDSLMFSEEIAKLTGLDLKSVYKHIRRLVDLGIITPIEAKQNERKKTAYFLAKDNLVDVFESINQKIDTNLMESVAMMKRVQKIIKNEKLSRK